jgi:hypothetical protein
MLNRIALIFLQFRSSHRHVKIFSVYYRTTGHLDINNFDEKLKNSDHIRQNKISEILVYTSRYKTDMGKKRRSN